MSSLLQEHSKTTACFCILNSLCLVFVNGIEKTQSDCMLGQFHSSFLSILQWVNLTAGEQVTPTMKKSTGNEITIVFHLFLYACVHTQKVLLCDLSNDCKTVVSKQSLPKTK